MATREPADQDRASPLSEHLWRYRSIRVAIYYLIQSNISDTGTITYMDERWVELTKSNNERLLIPINAIRIIKALEELRSEGEEKILLRPVEEPIAKAEDL